MAILFSYLKYNAVKLFVIMIITRLLFHFLSNTFDVFTGCTTVVVIVKCCWLLIIMTHGLTDSRTHELTDSRTHGLTNSRTHELTDARTHALTDSRSYRVHSQRVPKGKGSKTAKS